MAQAQAQGREPRPNSTTVGKLVNPKPRTWTLTANPYFRPDERIEVIEKAAYDELQRERDDARICRDVELAERQRLGLAERQAVRERDAEKERADAEKQLRGTLIEQERKRADEAVKERDEWRRLSLNETYTDAGTNIVLEDLAKTKRRAGEAVKLLRELLQARGLPANIVTEAELEAEAFLLSRRVVAPEDDRG